MWGVVIRLIIKILVFFVIPVVLGMVLSPKGDWASGMNFSDWFSTTSGCTLGAPGCSVANPDICWSCNLLGNLIDFFSDAITKAFEFMSSDLVVLILLGTAIWFAWFTFSQLAKQESVDSTSYFKEILKRMFRITAIIFLLGGLSVGKGDTTLLQTGVRNIIDPVFAIHTHIVKEVFNFPEGTCPTTPEGTPETGVISHGVKNSMLCTTGIMSMMVRGGMQSAGNLITFGNLSGTGFITSILGAFLYGIFLLFQIMIPFILLDILITIIIPLFFFPLILTGYAFKGSGYEVHLKGAFDTIISAGFKMVAVSVAFAFIYIFYSTIGDAYFPAPVDRYSYLFPNYLEKNENHVPSDVEKEFTLCYEKMKDMNPKAELSITERQTLKQCYKTIPNPEKDTGWTPLLLLFGLIQISMKLFNRIFGYMKDLMGGNSLDLGTEIYEQTKGVATGALNLAKSFASKGIGVIKK